MKKLICGVLLTVIFLALTACGDTADRSGGEEAGTLPISQEAEEAQDNQPGNEEPSYENIYDDEEPYEPYPTDSPIHGFALLYRGIFIEMDQDIDYLLPQLGEPLGIFEAPSCAFDGIDRIFGFPGMQIHTYPDGDLDRVHTISFLDDSIATTSGIRLGHSWADVVAAYGNDFIQDVTMFTFTIDRTTLSFFLEGDMVAGIIYGLIME